MPLMEKLRNRVPKPGTYSPGTNKRPGQDKTVQPPTSPAILQPSTKPGNVMGNQTPTIRPEVQTGNSPTQLASPVGGGLSRYQPTVPTAPGKTTSERTAEIIDKDSPLMRRAETYGKQAAATRGLLNTSLGIGAAQGAVLDRASQLARSDVQDNLNNFYAGIDSEKFKSDNNYRERVLEQERELQGKRLGLEERSVSLQEELGRAKAELEKHHLNLDRERFESDTEYRDRMLEQERVIKERALGLEEELGRGRLSLDEERFALQEEELKFRREFDQERFEKDEAYRQQVLAAEAKMNQQRHSLAMKQLAQAKANAGGGGGGKKSSEADKKAYYATVQKNEAMRRTEINSVYNNPNMGAADKERRIAEINAHYDQQNADAAEFYGMNTEVPGDKKKDPENRPDEKPRTPSSSKHKSGGIHDEER